jgi:PBP1b-binding outer membrane lipoprotein LpoB
MIICFLLAYKGSKFLSQERNMKKAVVLIAIVALILMGCPSVNVPYAIGDGTVGPRTGQASGKLILMAFGDVDAGMITAARNAGISKIGAVDFRVSSMFGIITTFTTTVTGQ